MFTFDPERERFDSFRPGQLALLNDPIVLDYGQALWVLGNESATWRQPGRQDVGVQDMWIFTRLLRRSASGEETDLLAGLPDALTPDLGPAQPLPFAMTFRAAPGLAGAVEGEAGERIDSISVHFGVIGNGQELPGVGQLIASDLTNVFFTDANDLLVAYSSPRFDQAARNIGEEDFIVLDLGGLGPFEAGDTLVADIAFGQLLPPGDPTLEDGLSPAEIFYRRWTAGTVLFTGSDAEVDNEFAIFEGVEMGISEEPSVGTSELRASQFNRTRITIRGKLKNAQRGFRRIRDEFNDIVPLPIQFLAPAIGLAKIFIADGVFVMSFGSQLVVNAGTPAPASQPPPPLPPMTDPPPPDRQPPTLKFAVVADTCDAAHGSLEVLVIAIDSGGLSPQAFSATGVGAALAEDPTVQQFNTGEELSFVKFSNATDGPKMVTVVARAVDLSGNETSEQQEFTVQPRCGNGTFFGFNSDGEIVDTPPWDMPTEILVGNPNESVEAQAPISFEADVNGDQVWTGVADPAAGDCFSASACSTMMPALGAGPGDTIRITARGRDRRAIADGEWF